MYNRYIGNTGQFYRVEDVAAPLAPPVYDPPSPPPTPDWPSPPPPPYYPPVPPEPAWAHSPPPPPYTPPIKEEKPKFDIGAMFNMPGNLRGTIKGFVPESLDLGDILLVLVLIYLFIEGDDDDMLIILGVLLFTWIWPLFKKKEEED